MVRYVFVDFSCPAVFFHTSFPLSELKDNIIVFICLEFSIVLLAVFICVCMCEREKSRNVLHSKNEELKVCL